MAVYERGLSLSTAATSLPVGIDELKTHSRIDATDEDAHLYQLLKVAVSEAETRYNRALVTQTWVLTLDAFPPEIRVPKPPLSSVSSIKYYDGANSQQTLSSSLYDVTIASDMVPGIIRPTYGNSWPSTYDRAGVVEVTFVAGYGYEADVPWPIKQWIYMRAAQLYENRESEVMPPRSLGYTYVVPRF